MFSFFDLHILLIGLFIFSARVVDVCLGTVRIIVTVQGRAVFAFCLAVIEISIWITAINTILKEIDQSPFLVLFYSFGYATGNVMGILVERKLALGKVILRVFAIEGGHAIAEKVRDLGQPVTIFRGEGRSGPVLELYIACKRRRLKWLLPVISEFDEKVFYVIEPATSMSKTFSPEILPQGGWLTKEKRK